MGSGDNKQKDFIGTGLWKSQKVLSKATRDEWFRNLDLIVQYDECKYLLTETLREHSYIGEDARKKLKVEPKEGWKVEYKAIEREDGQQQRIVDGYVQCGQQYANIRIVLRIVRYILAPSYIGPIRYGYFIYWEYIVSIALYCHIAILGRVLRFVPR